jgi:hypothetical protein
MSQIYSHENDSELTLDHIDTSPMDYDESLNFRINCRSGKFSGETNFWVSFDDWERFLYETKQINQSLIGNVTLNWGYVDEEKGKIQIQNIDKSGHLKMHVELKKRQIGNPGRDIFGVQLQFGIEPSELEKWLSQIQSIEYKKWKSE